MKVRKRPRPALLVRRRPPSPRGLPDARYDCGPTHKEGNLYCMIGREAVVGCDGVAVPAWFAPYVARRAVWNQIPLAVTVSVLRNAKRFPAALVDQLREWMNHHGYAATLTDRASKRPTVHERAITSN